MKNKFVIIQLILLGVQITCFMSMLVGFGRPYTNILATCLFGPVLLLGYLSTQRISEI